MTDNRAKSIIAQVAKKQIEQKFGSVANAITVKCGSETKMKRCKNCIEWFSTYQKAFKGMDCYKPEAGHCTRNIFDQCGKNYEHYQPKQITARGL